MTANMPDNLAAVAFFMLKNYLEAAEAEDDAFCIALNESYLANPDKGEGTLIEEVAARLASQRAT